MSAVAGALCGRKCCQTCKFYVLIYRSAHLRAPTRRPSGLDVSAKAAECVTTRKRYFFYFRVRAAR
eukprot:13615457-Alexandrium_andersonii.AAC.1